MKIEDLASELRSLLPEETLSLPRDALLARLSTALVVLGHADTVRAEELIEVLNPKDSTTDT